MNINPIITKTTPCGISIIDNAQVNNEYLASNLILTDIRKFKYGETNTLNIVQLITMSATTIINTTVNNHTSTDSLSISLTQDGYYEVSHFILPTLTWLQLQANSSNTNSILSQYTIVYYINNSIVYKYIVDANDLNKSNSIDLITAKATIVTSDELLLINADSLSTTSLYKVCISTFSTCNLEQCYLNYCNLIFKSKMTKCKRSNEFDSLIFNRDFIWMTLNVIQYKIEKQLFYECQRLLEEITSCGNFCSDTSVTTNYTSSNCGCN